MRGLVNPTLQGAASRRRRQGLRKEPSHSHDYIVPGVINALKRREAGSILDLGCGSGEITDGFRALGLQAYGTEFDPKRLEVARSAYPGVKFVLHDLNHTLPDDLAGRFDVVTAIEVVEHLLLPRALFARAREALAPGGRLIITTPYHGWLKNVAVAVMNKSDDHYMPWVDYGHVKFFSPATLGDLADECGFVPTGWDFVGRVSVLAKSMIMTATIDE